MRAGWRWVRAAAGTGLTWGLAVFGASVALWLVVGPDAADVFFPAGFAGFAFFGGVLFAVLLRVFEGGRGFDELSPRRAAAWGAPSGLLLAGIFVLTAAAVGETTPLEHFGLVAPVFALCGAVLAAVSAALVGWTGDEALVRTGAEALGLIRGRGRD